MPGVCTEPGGADPAAGAAPFRRAGFTLLLSWLGFGLLLRNHRKVQLYQIKYALADINYTEH